MRKILVIMAFAVLIAGCDSSGFSGIVRNRQGTSDFDPHTGSQGIEMKFVKDNPPLTVYQSSTLTNSPPTQFPVMIELWNRGASDIGTTDVDTEGYIYISGYDEGIIRGLRSQVEINDLRGKSAYNSYGGYQIMDMRSGSSPATVSLSDDVSEYKPRVQATACYTYYTEASPTVCIDSNPYTGVEEKPCKVGQINLKGSQGAPVAVSSIEQLSMPGSVQFRIRISNVGKGKVIEQGTVQNIASGSSASGGVCPFSIGYEDLNRLSYTVALDEGTTMNNGDCEPDPDEFRMTDGHGTIFCTFDISDTTGAFLTPLKIELSYGYMDSIYQDVTIRNLNT